MTNFRMTFAAFVLLAAGAARIPLADATPPLSTSSSSTSFEEAERRPVSPPVVVWTDTALKLTFEGPPPTLEPTTAPTATPQLNGSPGETSEPPSLTVRDRALGKLVELGATPWQIAIFDCLGRRESQWQSIRSSQTNADGTHDHGPFQINDIHWPLLNALGLDPYVPEDAAVFVWRLSSQGHNFRPWVTAAGCGAF